MEVITLNQLGSLFQRSNPGQMVILAREPKHDPELWMVLDAEKFLERIRTDLPLIKIALGGGIPSQYFDIFRSDDEIMELCFVRKDQDRSYRLFDLRYYQLLEEAILEKTITWNEYLSYHSTK